MSNKYVSLFLIFKGKIKPKSKVMKNTNENEKINNNFKTKTEFRKMCTNIISRNIFCRYVKIDCLPNNTKALDFNN